MTSKSSKDRWVKICKRSLPTILLIFSNSSTRLWVERPQMRTGYLTDLTFVTLTSWWTPIRLIPASMLQSLRQESSWINYSLRKKKRVMKSLIYNSSRKRPTSCKFNLQAKGSNQASTCQSCFWISQNLKAAILSRLWASTGRLICITASLLLLGDLLATGHLFLLFRAQNWCKIA